MSNLIYKFIEDLEIPDTIKDNLFKERNNKQLEEFAKNIPDLKYPDTYILAGRLLIYVNIKLCPKNIKDYVEILNHLLKPEIKEFMLKHKNILNEVIEETYYQNFSNQNILSASAHTLYLLRLSSQDPPVETPCMCDMRQAIQFYHQEGIEKVLACYYQLQEQLYVHASPTRFNAGLIKNQMSSCFVAGTKVFTYNRGVVNIEDVQIGDEVKTHKGNIKKVSQLHKNPLNEREVYNIKINRTFNIDVTGNHRFWAIQANGERKPKWVPIEYLCIGDYIAIPPKNEDSKYYIIDMKEGVEEKHIINIENNLMDIYTEYSSLDHLNDTNDMIIRKRKNSTVVKEFNADKQWAFFVGAWYGDGNIITKKYKDREYVGGIRVVAHKNNYKIVEKLTEIGENKLGISAKINKGTTYNKDLYYIDFHSCVLGNYFKQNYGKGFNGKKLDPRMYRWGGQEIKAFICGLFSTDGCWTKQNKLLIQLSNVKLMKDIFYLLRANGVPVRYNFIDMSTKKLSTEDAAVIELPFDYFETSQICKYYEDDRLNTKKDMKCSTRMKTINNQVFMRLEKKKLSDKKPEFVYTLGVEDDHSYCVEGVVAENCFLITLGDNIEDILYTGVADTGIISKHQGGIGLHLNNIRHSQIGNAGKSGGIMPFTETFDKNTKCVNQGTKRNGAATLFLNIWHIDIVEFIQARDNYTHNGVRFKSANTSIFISHLFMERVKTKGKWTVFCPAKARIGDEKLSGTYGPEFEDLYLRLEKEAPKKQQEFDDFCKEINDIEAKLNSKEDVSSEYVKNYQKMVSKRVKLRKNLIEYKTLDAYDLYRMICDMHVKSSHPFMTYRDPANMKNNMINIGVIEGSNLCVAPETLILTDKGQIRIIDLVGQKVNVWNGKEFSLVEPKKTGENQELVRVELNDQTYLECTKYHKFYIQNSRPYKNFEELIGTKYVDEIQAIDLKPGMKLVKCDYPIIDNDMELKHAYTNGFFTGVGTYNRQVNEENRRCQYKSIEGKAYCKRHIFYQKRKETSEICYSNKPIVMLYGEKIKLLPYLAYKSKGEIKDNRLNVILSTDLEDKYFVPVNYDLKSKLNWLAGLADADGYVIKNDDAEVLQITSNNKDFLLKVKYMLQTCGCNGKISVAMKAGKKLYETKEAYRILIKNNDIYNLISLGFKTYRLQFNTKLCVNKNNFVKVNSVIRTGRISDTYCFTETKRNAGIFNGVFGKNCQEILEPSDENNIASCNLGHIPLKTYAISPKKGIKVTKENLKDHFDFKLLKVGMMALVENINRVIDYNYYPLDERSDDKLTVIKQGKISKPNLANRPIGIGVSGLGECCALLKIAYDSDVAKYLNKMIFAAMYYYGLLSSHHLVKKYGHHYDTFRTGECKYFKENKWHTLKGSPLSNGLFQFDLWSSEADYLKSINRLDEKIYKVSDNIAIEPTEWGDTGSWESLRDIIVKDGVMNSMILAPMPTASTSQLVRSAEAFEAHQTLIYSRKLVHGNITVFSEPFVDDMKRLGLWTKEMIEFINMENGSIRHIDHFVKDNLQYFKDISYEDIKVEIAEMKNIHRGMYEISQKDVMQMARQRGIYVDQSQSLNIYIADPTIEKMMGVHMYGSALRLKTGMYYLRQNPASQTDRFTVDIAIKEYHENLLKKLKSKFYKFKVVNNEEVCLSCS